jgi:hypothetical protein
MQLKSVGWLAGLAAAVLASACGGRPGTDLDAGAGAGTAAVGGQDSASSAPTGMPTDQPPSTAPSGGSTGPGSLGPSGGSASPGGSGPTSPPPPILTTPGDAGCAPSSWQPGQSFSACWDCIWRGCWKQLTACAAECGCSQTVAKGIACANAGNSPSSCLGPGVGPGPGGTGGGLDPSIGPCLSLAASECGCASGSAGGTATSVPACAPMESGGAGGGNGQCENTVTETCGGTVYQVTCACPQATCACIGPSSQIIPYSGCANGCPGFGPAPPQQSQLAALLTQCGFPH